MVFHGAAIVKGTFIFFIAAAAGCGAVILQPLTQGTDHVVKATKSSETGNASPAHSEKKPKQTLAQKMNHENDRMSGKVLWRNNKNHAAGSDCLCSFAANKHKCDKNHDDDSHCFLVCCIAGKSSDCKCGWAIGAGACEANKNDGSDCFASCCNDVAKDLETYGPMAYPGAELLYPPGSPVPRNPFWKDDLPQASQVQQLYPTGTQPANMSQGYPAAQAYSQPATNMSQGYSAAQGYPQPAANMSQGYPAAQGYPQPAANMSQGTPAQYSGSPSAHPYQTQYHGPATPAANMSYGYGNASGNIATNARLVQRSHRQHSHKHKHNKGNRK